MSNNNDMIKMVRLMEGQQFAGQAVGQKPGDQVRGTDKAVAKGTDHPFKGRLVGEETALEDVLSKKYQDFKEVQSKEKPKQKEKQEEKEIEEFVEQAAVETFQAIDEEEQLAEFSNPQDKVTVDIPLLIRIMEYAREDAGSDMDLHDVAENLIRLSASGKTLGMSDYDSIVGHAKESSVDAQVLESFADHSPVSQAIARRILHSRADLLQKYGPEKIMQAIDDVADFVGDVEEIGTSDVSGWVRQVERNLGHHGVEEDAPFLAKAAGGLAVGGLAAVGAPAIVGMLGPLLGIPLAAYGAYNAAKGGMWAVENLWDAAAKKLGGEDKVEQYVNSKIAKLPPDKARAVQQTMNAVKESRLNELGADSPEPPQGTATNPATASPTTANTAPTSGSISPDEQKGLDKINQNPVMKQQFDKLMTQASPAKPGGKMDLDPEQTDALEKLKANAGLKTQYDKLIKQANPQAGV